MTIPGLDAPEYHFSPATPAIVIGAGLAGCALACALVRAGFTCTLYDRQNTVASETSAVPCALFRPQVSRTEHHASRYLQQAFNRIHTEITGEPDTVTVSAQATGVLQLVKDCQLWPESESYRKLTKADASQKAGAELAGDALYFDRGGWFDINRLCRRWISQCKACGPQHTNFIGNTAVHSLLKTTGGWQLKDAYGGVIDESPLVIVACAELATRLAETSHLPLQRSRGQISHFTRNSSSALGIPTITVTGKGSVIPVSSGFWAGSTHQRQQNSPHSSTQDDQLNLKGAMALCPQIAETIAQPAVADKSWVGFRYSTPDRLPVVGAAPVKDCYLQDYADLRHGRRTQSFPQPHFHHGLYLLTGFGSRGALHSVHAAEILTDVITGKMNSAKGYAQTLNHILHPGRFIIRQLRRGL